MHYQVQLVNIDYKSQRDYDCGRVCWCVGDRVRVIAISSVPRAAWPRWIQANWTKRTRLQPQSYPTVPILIITISSCLSSPKRSNKHYCIFFESCFDWYVECVESVLRFHESSRRSEEYYAPLMGERHAREKTLPLRFFWGEVAGVLGEVGSSRFSSLGVGETWSFRTLEGEDVQVDHIAFLWFLGADGKSLHFPLQQPCRKWLRNLPFHSIFLKLGWFVLVDSCCNFTVQENSTLPGGIGPSWNSHHFIVHYIIIVDRWWLLNQVLVLQLPVKCKAVSRICKNQIF